MQVVMLVKHCTDAGQWTANVCCGYIKLTTNKFEEFCGEVSPSLIILILLCGPVDKVWTLFITYSIGFMFKRLSKIYAHFIVPSTV